MATVICENCGTENPDNVKFCKQCGTRLLTTVEPTTTSTTAIPPLPLPPPSSQPVALIEKRYGALRSIAALCRALAIIFAALIILAGIASLFIGYDYLGFGGIISLIGSLISAALVYVFWRVIGESISVQLDIEENTRRTATLLERQMK